MTVVILSEVQAEEKGIPRGKDVSAQTRGYFANQHAQRFVGDKLLADSSLPLKDTTSYKRLERLEKTQG